MDRPEDPGAGEGDLLGVVIPALDEAERLPALLDDLRRLPPGVRVLVVDGGSTDGTPEVARAGGARVVEAPTGRASQLAEGARHLDTPWLLFLHADCRLPPGTRRALMRWLRGADPRRSAHFAFRLEGSDPFWRLVEVGQRLRERFAGLVYGDQGLLVSRETYRAVGGYPDLPLMEDVAMVDRVRRHGPLERIPAPLPTSPRRYRREGRWRAWLRNALLVVLYRMGAPPAVLARFYPRHPPPPPP